MYKVDVYLRVRRAVMVDGMSMREAARVFGLHRDTVRKMLAYSVPPGYRRQSPPRKPKLEPYTGVIDRILEDDLRRPRKQRHTAKRIFERLRDEYGFDGGYTTVKDYVRENRRQTKEMFVPLSHAPGHAQCDFGEALVVIGGVERKAHCFVLDLPHSDGCFVKAYPAETTEAFLDGHVSAFAYLGGVPQSILYDNTRLAVAKILGDGRRQRTRAFTELQSHYLFEDRFGRPGKGNDKGKVEGLVGYVRRNFLVPATPVPTATPRPTATPVPTATPRPTPVRATRVAPTPFPTLALPPGVPDGLFRTHSDSGHVYRILVPRNWSSSYSSSSNVRVWYSRDRLGFLSLESYPLPGDDDVSDLLELYLADLRSDEDRLSWDHLGVSSSQVFSSSGYAQVDFTRRRNPGGCLESGTARVVVSRYHPGSRAVGFAVSFAACDSSLEFLDVYGSVILPSFTEYAP